MGKRNRICRTNLNRSFPLFCFCKPDTLLLPLNRISWAAGDQKGQEIHGPPQQPGPTQSSPWPTPTRLPPTPSPTDSPHILSNPRSLLMGRLINMGRVGTHIPGNLQSLQPFFPQLPIRSLFPSPFPLLLGRFDQPGPSWTHITGTHGQLIPLLQQPAPPQVSSWPTSTCLPPTLSLFAPHSLPHPRSLPLGRSIYLGRDGTHIQAISGHSIPSSPLFPVGPPVSSRDMVLVGVFL